MDRIERRLAAIMAADVVGYSRLMGRDEAGTLRRMKALRRELIDGCIGRYRGRLVKTTGDGLLIEFPSVVDAFACARALQDGLRARDPDLAEDDRLKLRIGINVGDIIFDDGDVFGDGVNVAARLEPLAPVGGICVSDRAYADLRRLGLPFENKGEQRLKNIAAPVGIHCLSADALAQLPPEPDAHEPMTGPPAAGRRKRAVPAAALAALAPIVLAGLVGAWWFGRDEPVQPSLALARFEAIGAGLPSGIVETIDSELRAAFGQEAAPLTTGDAGLIVSGTVRRIDGDRLRFSTRVNEAAGGAMLWSGDVEGSLGDGDAQGRFARRTAATIDCALSAAARHPEPLPSAGLSLALHACAEQMSGDFGRLLVAARRLVRDSPDFWLGWHQVAYAISGQEMAGGAVRDPALSAEAVAAAERVIALLPEDAEGYTALAVAFAPQRPGEREALLRRATAARPEECACSLMFLGDFLIQAGRTEEALDFYRQGLDQNVGPLSAWRVATGNYLSGRSAAGDEALRQALQLSGGRDGGARRLSFTAALWGGRWEEAAGLLDMPRPEEQAALGAALRALAAGDAAAIRRARAPVERLAVQPENELLVVPILAALGANDAVFQRLEASRGRGGYYSAPGRMPGFSRPLLFDPMLRALWDDRRFPAFLRRAGFIAYWRESRTRPDICRGEAAPSFCRLLG